MLLDIVGSLLATLAALAATARPHRRWPVSTRAAVLACTSLLTVQVASGADVAKGTSVDHRSKIERLDRLISFGEKRLKGDGLRARTRNQISGSVAKLKVRWLKLKDLAWLYEVDPDSLTTKAPKEGVEPAGADKSGTPERSNSRPRRPKPKGREPKTVGTDVQNEIFKVLDALDDLEQLNRKPKDDLAGALAPRLSEARLHAATSFILCCRAVADKPSKEGKEHLTQLKVLVEQAGLLESSAEWKEASAKSPAAHGKARQRRPPQSKSERVPTRRSR